jgi:arylamine N-acetyltransferase
VRLAALDNGRVDAYLARLGTPDVRHDAAGLARLQAAHLMAVPFHNLLLLANDGRPWGLQALHEVVDEAIAGVGGNCDRTTPPFTALLQAVGFDARLAAATVREPGDHFVSVVQAEGGRFLCDVGNGHPYLRPWDLDGPVQEQSFQGWRFRFDPKAPGGPTLLRTLPDGTMKTVYVVDPAPRGYEDFAPIVSAHYTQAGFGPFLQGLRATAIRPDAVLTLRDAVYTRHTRFGAFERKVGDRSAAAALLHETFNLPTNLASGALDSLARRNPELFVPRSWWPSTQGLCVSAATPAAARDDVPDVLISVGTVGRQEALTRLLTSLADELDASAYPGDVAALILDNDPSGTGAAVAAAEAGRARGLPVWVRHADAYRADLARIARLGLLPTGIEGELPIGGVREAQVAALRRHLDEPIPGLPHPARRPTVVWMLDDDLAFQQLGPNGRVERLTPLLHRVARLWATLPHRSVLLGTFTGDPPVPPLDTMRGQVGDLRETVRWMLNRGPHAPWEPPDVGVVGPDPYYDLSEQRHVGTWSPFRPVHATRVREAALELLHRVPSLLDGEQITRPLAWDGTEVAPRPSVRRGGNTLFLDWDALFRWPTPVYEIDFCSYTRRADTLWATLAQREDPTAVAEVTLPLLHGRTGQGGPRGRRRRWPTSEGQIAGTALARTLASGGDVEQSVSERIERVRAHRVALSEEITSLQHTLAELAAWEDRWVSAALTAAMEALGDLAAWVHADARPSVDPAPLRDALARLPDAVRAWRGGW